MSSNAEHAATDAPAQPSMFARWYVLIMMVTVYTLSIADRYVISTVMEPIRLELQLDDSGIAMLTGVSLALFYVVFGFPLSALIDRGNRRKIIAASVVVWSLMTTWTGLARNYWELLASRIGVGIGEAGGTPGANSILSDYFPAARRPMALAFFSLGAPIGAWLGADVAGAIADASGWRAAFLWLGVPGAIFGVLLYLTVREPRRGQLDDAALLGVETPKFLETLRYLRGQNSAVHLILANALTALWGWGLAWWTPTFLVRSYDLSVGEAGAITGPIHLIGGSVATALTAWLIGRPMFADPRRIVWLMGGGVGIASVASWFIYSTHSLALSQGLMWIFIPAIYFYIGTSFGILNNLVEPRMRAMACACLLFLANVGNLIIAPQAVGMLSDAFAPASGPDAASLRLAVLCLVPTGFWAAFHFFWSARKLIPDQERATGLKVQVGSVR